MSAKTLNFWQSKFVQEVAKQNGEQHQPRVDAAARATLEAVKGAVIVEQIKIASSPG